MDYAKSLRRGFDRVLTGRVAKPSKSPTRGRSSAHPTKSNDAHRDAAIIEEASQSFIKQEDNNDSDVASFPHILPNEVGVESAPKIQPMKPYEEEMDQRDGSDEEMIDTEDKSDSEEQCETTTSLSPGSCSEEAIPSIEADEEDISPPKPKPLPYLYGASKSKKNVMSLRVGYFHENSDDERDENAAEDEVEDDEDGLEVANDVDDDLLEEALDEEWEENLLIAEEDLRDYVKHKLTIEQIDSWPKEAARLYKLLYLRGLYPLMSYGWIWDFFGHPMPDDIFTPRGSDDKTLIKAYANERQGARAIVDLFKLYSRVRALRQGQIIDRIGPVIEKGINVYLRWATKDAELRKIGYQIDFAWPVFVIDFSRAHDADSIMRACRKRVQQYQAKWAELGIIEYPRLITVFAIIQHMVVILVVDIDNHETQEPMPMTEIDLSALNHWLDCAIAISIPIMLARESLMVYRESFPVTEKEEADLDL